MTEKLKVPAKEEKAPKNVEKPVEGAMKEEKTQTSEEEGKKGTLTFEKSKIVEPEKTVEVKKIDLSGWNPRTSLGKSVKEGKITHIDQILDYGLVIMEPEIVDSLLMLENDLLLIGQSKGKFGGGQRRVFKQTQKKTKEGNKPQFTAMAVVGNRNGYVGIGLGKAKETVPAREKALKRAKINIFKIRRGCGSWEGTDGPNSIPFSVKGRCGSVRVKFIPAPTGKGLVTEKEVAKVLSLAGVEDVWSKSFGHTEHKINLIKATEEALKQLMLIKVSAKTNQNLRIFEGEVNETS